MLGFWIGIGTARVYITSALPKFSDADFVVLSTFSSVTGQWLMRLRLRGTQWLFWGERLRAKSGILGWIQRTLIRPMSKASVIVGIGRLAEFDYQSRFPKISHFCIPYHCELSAFFSSRLRRAVGEPITFLFCGQMIRRKGVDLLLRAFDRLISNGMDARLLLVGREADLPEFLEMISPQARAKVIYQGFQPPECLPEFFAKGHVFVLPSRHDGWGVVVNQALAAGLPIITSDAVGAGVDLVADGVNGICIKANDVDALYRAMDALASGRADALAWGERSREIAYDLTPEAGARKWVRVFDSLENIQLRKEPKHAQDAEAMKDHPPRVWWSGMNVLLVSSGSGSRGGGEIFLDYLGKGLVDRGHRVTVWMPNQVRMDELAAKCGRFARVVRADYRNTYDYASRSLATSINWRTSRLIAQQRTALQPDVVHINKQNLEDGLDLLRAAGVLEHPQRLYCPPHADGSIFESNWAAHFAIASLAGNSTGFGGRWWEFRSIVRLCCATSWGHHRSRPQSLMVCHAWMLAV